MNEKTEQQNEEPLDVFPGILSLKDNRQLRLGGHQLSEQQLGLLRHFSGKKLKEIKRSDDSSSEGLVIIGNIDAIKDNDILFELLETSGSKTSDGETDKKYIVQAHNIMGVFTLRHGDAQLRMQITSRFDNLDKQPFLCWMLERVLRITLSDLVDTNRDSSFWTILLELLFWKRLGEASSVGLYRQYQRFEYNDLRFRGRLDIDRHIRLNMPLWDKMAYSRREITYDNPINHLLRHAARIVMSHWRDQDAILNGQDNKNSLDMVGAIEANTPSWTFGNIHNLLMKKELLRGINHPYYAEYYEELRILALCIILEHGVDLYTRSTPIDFSINGILFDGAWLWEEYLNTILAGEGYWHAIPMDTLPIYALKKEKRPLFPDFRLPNGTSKQQASVILDAKYKRGDKVAGLAVKREDMHQCFCYMFLTGAVAGGVIYPPFLKEEEVTEDDVNDEDLLKICCPDERYWRCFTFGSVDNCTDDTFPKTMQANEDRLIDFVHKFKELVKSKNPKIP